jgi:hypothetical protein
MAILLVAPQSGAGKLELTRIPVSRHLSGKDYLIAGSDPNASKSSFVGRCSLTLFVTHRLVTVIT